MSVLIYYTAEVLNLFSFQNCSSGASDASSVSAEHGSPPRSRAAYSDEDDEQISNWVNDVAASTLEKQSQRDPGKCYYDLFHSELTGILGKAACMC